MSTIQPPIPVRVKDKTLSIEEDNIVLHSHQVRAIRTAARRKTEIEWLNSRSGVKVTLTAGQQIQILNVKDQIFHYLSPNKSPKEILRKTGSIGFAIHAFDRILERVERFSEEEIDEMKKDTTPVIIDPDTLEKIIEALIHSQKVFHKAEWNGFPYLNYTFLCYLGDRELDVVVNFDAKVLIITIVVSIDTGYFVREKFSYDKDQKKIYKKD